MIKDRNVAAGEGEEAPDDLLERVVVERITYVSDGLRVRGYLVTPVSGDALPAVIFNRGGNRDFGRTAAERHEMNTAVEAFRNAITKAS